MYSGLIPGKHPERSEGRAWGHIHVFAVKFGENGRCIEFAILHALRSKEVVAPFGNQHTIGLKAGRPSQSDVEPVQLLAVSVTLPPDFFRIFYFSFLVSLVSNVVDRSTQEKIDVVKTRLIKSYGYCEICSTDVLNFVASIFARGDVKKRS